MGAFNPNNGRPNGLSIDLEDLELSVREPLGLPLPSRSDYLSDHTARMLELLAEHGATATFFVNGRSAERHPGLLARIAEAGHEIAAHGFTHRFLSAYRSAVEFREDLERCLELIRRECGVRPAGYRAPGFTLAGHENVVLPVLKEMGFEYSSSVLPVGQPIQHGYRRGPTRQFRWPNGIVELPLSSWAFLSVRLPAFGSWSLRLLPLANTLSALQRLNRAGRAGFLYLHSWEVFEQPVSRAVANARFPVQRIWMLAKGPTMERRLRALLRRHRFVCYRELVDSSAPYDVPSFR